MLVSTLPVALSFLFRGKPFVVPWLPIAMIGTAVAFMTGFKNNASYARLWEARQIWGAIVNLSRTWAMLVISSVPEEGARRRLIYRHCAWLTALRYQLRERRVWESMNRAHNVEYGRKYKVAEWDGQLEANLADYLSPADLGYVAARKNRALHLLDLQCGDLGAAVPPEHGGTIEQRIELRRVLASLVDAQGRSERIKNFPYPRQYATLNNLFVWMFIVLAPFGLMQEFQKLGESSVWLTIPAGTIVSWVFHTMDKIGEGTENPFEGGPNDVPITAMSRAIEIDLREMLGETAIPPALQPDNHILM